jgi:cell division septum initiation protein DivIVA
MLRPDPARIPTQRNGSATESNTGAAGQSNLVPTVGDIDIQQELNKLEELILGSPRVPFSGRTMVDEDQLLDQLDAVRLNLPPAFRQAVDILQRRNAIISEAERYAEDLVAAAEQQAAQMLDELGIVRQAEQMAQQIKGQAQQECDTLRSQVITDIEQLQLQAQREWESMRQEALSEQAMIQQESDAYADRVLGQVEQQLSQMLRIIQNGRSHLQPEPAVTSPAPTTTRRPAKTKVSGSSQTASEPRPDRPHPKDSDNSK